MTMKEPDDDQDALSWEGDEEFGRAPATSSYADAPEDDAPLEANPAVAVAPRSPASTAAVVVFGALLLAISVGWVIAATQNPVQQPSLVGLIMYQFGQFLTIIGGVVWFAVVLRNVASTPSRILWWSVGVVLLFPWTLVIGQFA
ncbi:hypothetical protein [Humidisolicoccus flavus]|uniref:hypothetical protein n=1 Tax=Humidisolicoccus flavus TaxID=3111414 RepID=UPI0032528D98